MQLVAGFIGTDVDTLTHALTPKMGWVVRQMEGNDSIVKRLQEMDSMKHKNIDVQNLQSEGMKGQPMPITPKI